MRRQSTPSDGDDDDEDDDDDEAANDLALRPSFFFIFQRVGSNALRLNPTQVISISSGRKKDDLILAIGH